MERPTLSLNQLPRVSDRVLDVFALTWMGWVHQLGVAPGDHVWVSPDGETFAHNDASDETRYAANPQGMVELMALVPEEFEMDLERVTGMGYRLVLLSQPEGKGLAMSLRGISKRLYGPWQSTPMRAVCSCYLRHFVDGAVVDA